MVERHRNGNTTSITLIARLCDQADQDAWDRFVDQYSPLIFSWCLRFKLQETDAADVTQEVLLKLVGLMKQNTYDSQRGGFRAWLKTITSNLIRDLLKSTSRKAVADGGSQILQRLAQVADPDSIHDLGKLIEDQYERELLNVASQRVKGRVQHRTWSSYVGTAIESRSASDVAAELNMPISEVYVCKSRVLKMLRDEVRKLNSTLD